MELLNNKVAIITGGTKGIGKAIAELFLANGATVIVGARTKPTDLNERIAFYDLDISDMQSCEKFYQSVSEKYGKIDILVNNAGVMKDRTTAKMSTEEFDSVVDTNLKGTFNMVRLFGVRFDFLPQPFDMYRQRLRFGKAVKAPNLIEKIILVQRFAGILYKKEQ